MSVRNSFNDLLWLAGLIAYLVISGVAHREIGSSRVQIGANLLLTPLTAIFLAWSGRVLSAKRIELRSLAPFAIVASLALAVYFAGAAVYVPHLFSSYASRYGAIGAVFAMISALFGFMVALVASAALGREVFDELNRIRAGERPADDEVRREWNTFIREARSRWQTLRDQSRSDPQKAAAAHSRRRSVNPRPRRDDQAQRAMAGVLLTVHPSPEIPLPISAIPNRPTIAAMPASLLVWIQPEKRLTVAAVRSGSIV